MPLLDQSLECNQLRLLTTLKERGCVPDSWKSVPTEEATVEILLEILGHPEASILR